MKNSRAFAQNAKRQITLKFVRRIFGLERKKNGKERSFYD